METETISDLSDCITSMANAVDSKLITHERAFEIVNALATKIEEELARIG